MDPQNMDPPIAQDTNYRWNLLIFDWSGTISNDSKPVLESDNQLLTESGLPPITEEKWRNCMCANIIDFSNHIGLVRPTDNKEEREEYLFLFFLCYTSNYCLYVES